MRTYYHYTSKSRLESILASGIELSPRNPSILVKGERQAVWLTTSEEWEPTVFYGQEVTDKIRLTVKAPEAKHHTAYKTLPSKIYKRLMQTAKALRSPTAKWYVSPIAIRPEDIISIKEI